MRLSRSVGPATLLLLLGFAPSGQADIICTGRIGGVFTDRLGKVMAYTTFRGDWLQVCNVKEAWNGVTVDVCKTWIATLTTLRVTQEPAAMYYTDYVNGTSCLAIPTYDQAAAPHYISINVP